MDADQKDRILKRLRSISNTAMGAQDHIHNVEAFGAQLESMDEDMEAIVKIMAEKDPA